MKQTLAHCIAQSIQQARQESLFQFDPELTPEIVIENPAEKSHGDFACTIAMRLAKVAKMSPRAIAEIIADRLEHETIAKVEIAGPGFINFFIQPSYYFQQVQQILSAGENYGRQPVCTDKSVMVEFVSANPTGPLHIGHGRGAAVGDAIARILSFAGWNIFREYYVNDAGNQMNNLGRSTYIRYMQLLGYDIQLDDQCYQGEYIRDIARDILTKYGPKFEGDESCISLFTQLTGDVILQGIREDLATFRVYFDNYFSEITLHNDGQVEQKLSELKQQNKIYEKDSALWARTSDFGDDKDRVVQRTNGETTYFAADIAYHRNKIERGFHTMIDVWGADHHGYVPRMKAAIQLLGRDPADLEIVLIQLVSLLRSGEPVAMSTRSGEFDSLIDVINEVGTDAARYFFLMRRSDSHLDFDLELAKQQTNDNPVFYVQYCHARCCSILEQLKTNNLYYNINPQQINLDCLDTTQELELCKSLCRFPEVIQQAASTREPHRIPHYLNEVASAFHSFYNVCHVMGAPDDKRLKARTLLVEATAQVVRNGLEVIGVSAPQKM
ncbi:arginine--tRNA ligase [Desulfurispira natronophila]|uniref:Arginine--tRNA ligase n=1 Tax=Desulfurispira natronophila TaxID=682562 RepID=A0A7W8DG08_9BACT|nr:arginine--tRNA ligase [Desulfurispira natronophila]MBB5020986.1 arginyl-tRNA synthetase [Desulfurispira natronophila]